MSASPGFVALALLLGGCAAAPHVRTELWIAPFDGADPAVAAAARWELAERLAWAPGVAFPFPGEPAWTRGPSGLETAWARGRVDAAGRLRLEVVTPAGRALWSGEVPAGGPEAAARVAEALGSGLAPPGLALPAPLEPRALGALALGVEAQLLGREALSPALLMRAPADCWCAAAAGVGLTLVGETGRAVDALSAAREALPTLLGAARSWIALERDEAYAADGALRHAALAVLRQARSRVPALAEATAAGAEAEARDVWGEDRARLCSEARRASEDAQALAPLFGRRLMETSRPDRDDEPGRDCTGGTPLHAAVDAGDEAAVRALLAARADVRATNKAGETALHRAARVGSQTIAELLLAADAGLAARVDDFGRTPLVTAIRAGHDELAHALLARSGRVEARTAEGRNALHEAMRLGRAPLVGRLVGAATGAVTAWGDDGATPLHLAVRADQAGAVAAFVAATGGRALDVADRDGVTPLGLALALGRAAIALRLVEAGAAVDGAPGAEPPLLALLGTGEDAALADGLRWLVAHGARVDVRGPDGGTALHRAAARPTTMALDLALAAGLALDAADGGGLRAIDLAARWQRLDGVRHILAEATRRRVRLPLAPARLQAVWTGADEVLAALLAAEPLDPRAPIEPGLAQALTPWGRDEAVRLYLGAGVPPDALDPEGRSFLHLAAAGGHMDLVERLLAAGASPSARWRGLRPLDWAVLQGSASPEVIERLAGADDLAAWAVVGDLARVDAGLARDPAAVTRLGPDGLGALHHAARAGRVEVVQRLLASGAPVDLRAGAGVFPELAGWTPLHFACAAGDEPTVLALVAAGGDLTARDDHARPAWRLEALSRGGLACSASVATGPDGGLGAAPLPAPEDVLLGSTWRIRGPADNNARPPDAFRPGEAAPAQGFRLSMGLGVQLWPEAVALSALARAVAEDGGWDDLTSADGLDAALLVCEAGHAWRDARRVARDLAAERRLADPPSAVLTALADQNLAVTLAHTGEPRAARDGLVAALAALAAAPAAARAAVAENLAEVGWQLGDHAAAAQALTDALALRDLDGATGGREWDPERARNRVLMGMVETERGRYAEALAALEAAIARPLDDDPWRTGWYARLDLAVLRAALGDHARAGRLLDEALAALQSRGLAPPVELAVTQHDRARVLLRAGRAADALRLAREARDGLRQADPDHWALGRVQLGLGHAALASGDLDAAEAAYTEAGAAVLRARGELHGDRAEVLRHLAAVKAARGDPAGARELLGQAWSIAAAADAPEVRWPIELELGRAAARAGRTDEAILLGQEAVLTLQGLREAARGLGGAVDAGFVEDRVTAWRELAGWLVAAGRLPEALAVLGQVERDEAQSLDVRRGGLGKVADVPRSPRDVRAGAALAAEGAELVRLGADYQALLEAKRLGTLGAGAARLDAVRAAVAAGRKRFEAALQGFAADPEGGPEAAAFARAVHDTAALQGTLGALGHGAVLIHYLVSPSALRVVLTTPVVQVAHTVPCDAEALGRLVGELREALVDPRSDPRPTAGELYDLLLAPLADDLRAARAETLVVAPDQRLRYVPFAALFDGDGWLVERYRVAIYSVAGLDRVQAPPSPAPRIAALGVSNAAGYAPLGSVPAELEGIVRRDALDQDGVLAGALWLDARVTRQALIELLEDQRFHVLHLASHFVLRPGTEADSFLVLGDGTTYTLEDVRAGPAFAGVELVNLSACETAVGLPDANGRELESLAALTLDRGATSVIASLWPVADQSTARLARDLYAARGATPTVTLADALREAQLRLLRGGPGIDPAWSHPYHWAPFILIGRWL